MRKKKGAVAHECGLVTGLFPRLRTLCSGDADGVSARSAHGTACTHAEAVADVHGHAVQL